MVCVLGGVGVSKHTSQNVLLPILCAWAGAETTEGSRCPRESGLGGVEAIPPHISALPLKAVCFSTSASGLGGFQISSEGRQNK